MPKGGNKMDTKSDDQIPAIKATIEANKQVADNNHRETTENTKQLTDTLNQVLVELKDKKNISKYSPAQKDTLTTPEPTTTV